MTELRPPENRNANWYRRLSLRDRLRLSYEVQPDGCWRWLGSTVKRGYGQVRYKGRPQRAHRVMYEVFVGPIPDGLTVDHLCRNKACVNPEHLEPVTAQENHRRWVATITECAKGHPLTPENTQRRGSEGRRLCAICRRDRENERHQARRAAGLSASGEYADNPPEVEA